MFEKMATLYFVFLVNNQNMIWSLVSKVCNSGGVTGLGPLTCNIVHVCFLEYDFPMIWITMFHVKTNFDKKRTKSVNNSDLH